MSRRTFRPLSELPIFASDMEIAVAVVGPERAGDYVRNIIPVLERHGFPPFCPLHKGRNTLLVKTFYGPQAASDVGARVIRQDGQMGPWKRSRRSKAKT
jgi:hypothetical protein